MNADTRQHIQTALQAFSGADLRTASIGLLNSLGYKSEKTLDLSGSPEAFLDQFDNNPERGFHKEKAIFEDWKEIHLLFQLTDQELSDQNSLFVEHEVKQGLMSSSLFFALRLKGQSYARGRLAQITRQLNRLFPMPVMVFCEYDEKLSIAVISHRQSKRNGNYSGVLLVVLQRVGRKGRPLMACAMACRILPPCFLTVER